MKIGVGLPRFLVEEGNQIFVLSFFFLFLLVVLPMIFLCYYQRQKKYARRFTHEESWEPQMHVHAGVDSSVTHFSAEYPSSGRTLLLITLIMGEEEAFNTLF